MECLRVTAPSGFKVHAPREEQAGPVLCCEWPAFSAREPTAVEGRAHRKRAAEACGRQAGLARQRTDRSPRRGPALVPHCWGLPARVAGAVARPQRSRELLFYVRRGDPGWPVCGGDTRLLTEGSCGNGPGLSAGDRGPGRPRWARGEAAQRTGLAVLTGPHRDLRPGLAGQAGGEAAPPPPSPPSAQTLAAPGGRDCTV